MHASIPMPDLPPRPEPGPVSESPIANTPPTDAPESAGKVLLYAAQPEQRQKLSGELSRRGFEVRTAETVEAANTLLLENTFAVCLVDDIDMVGDVRELASTIQREKMPTQLVGLLSRDSEWGTAVIPSFEFESIEKPYTATRLGSALFSSVERADLRAENFRLKRQLNSRNLQDIVGNGSAVASLRESISVAAEDDGTVLIRGEAGTGTNLVAQGIHRCSKRAWRPFLRIDCSVHSAESLERLMFGGPAGPDGFGQEGALLSAGGGTILLDNVDCIALPFQKQLLRLMEEKRFKNPATGETRPINVRFVSATHVDINKLAEEGQFREDLLHKLTNVTIQTPPLRLHREDIALLVEHFLNQLAVREGRPVRRITVDALQLLETHEWPANVRELENVIERACTVDDSPRLCAEDLKPWMGAEDSSTGEAVGLSLRDMERKLIETTFARCGGNRERTAKILKIGLRTLSGKLREYGYPPRGGPGSNIKAAAQRRAA